MAPFVHRVTGLPVMASKPLQCSKTLFGNFLVVIIRGVTPTTTTSLHADSCHKSATDVDYSTCSQRPAGGQDCSRHDTFRLSV